MFKVLLYSSLNVFFERKKVVVIFGKKCHLKLE